MIHALASGVSLGHYIGRVPAPLETGIRRAQVLVWLAVALLAFATFACSDLLTTPGVGSVSLAYGGQSQVVVGSSTTVTVTATADGGTVAGARFVLTSSDTAVLVVRGDTLVARRLGSATITASLISSLVGGTPPSVSQAVAVVPRAVVIDSSSVTFRSLGDTVTVVATVLDADSQPVAGAPVQWTSVDTTKVGVTPAGRLQARAVGTVLVIAASGIRADTVNVTVTQVLAHYSFAAPVFTFNALTAVQTVAATPHDARGSPIASGAAPTYQVLDQSIATVNASTGALTSAFNGTTYLVAFKGSVRDSVQVTVAQKAKQIAIAPKPVPTLSSVNDSRQLTASAVDSLNVPIASAQPIWIPLSTTVYTLTQSGLVTALAPGSAFVVATLDGQRDSVTITVTNDPGSVRITPDTATATSVGDTLLFQAIARNLRGDSIGVAPSWRTPDASGVVSVLSDGHVVALKTGTARVIAQAGTRADTSIAVVTNVPASVSITPDTRTLTALADADTPSVSILNGRGATLSRAAAQWTSDDPAIARVNAQGIITAVDTGQTIIRACYPASCLLQDSVTYVVQNVPTSVAIVLPPRGTSGAGTRRDTLTAIGQALPLGLNVLNHRGAAIAGYPVTWSSTDQTVVDSVRANAVVTIGFGTTKVVALAGTIADTLTLVVRNPTRIIVDNSVIANPRVGTLSRPYLRIQDAVAAADANDTVQVRRGSGPYTETVALSKRLILLGDSSSFVSGSRNPANLPLIAHDTGAAAITAFTSAPQTIKYLAIRHTLDGPALADSGSDVIVDNLYVNPSGSTTTRIGRGISIKNSLSGTRITNSVVDSVRGYGLRLEAVSNARIRGVVVVGVDSLPGLEEGAGIKLVSGNADTAVANFVRSAQIGILVTGTTAARVDTNVVWRNLNGLRISGGTTASVAFNDIFDNTADTLPIGVVNPAGTSLALASTWWGDSLGPRLNAVPLATGDSVVGAVTVGALRARPFLSGGAAAALRIVRGNNQTRSAGNPLNQPFAVRVVDASGLPVTSGVTVVTFATSSGGSFGTATPTSNSSGLAETVYTLSSTKGVNTVTATITVNSVAVSVTFTATGT